HGVGLRVTRARPDRGAGAPELRHSDHHGRDRLRDDRDHHLQPHRRPALRSDRPPDPAGIVPARPPSSPDPVSSFISVSSFSSVSSFISVSSLNGVILPPERMALLDVKDLKTYFRTDDGIVKA